MKINLNSIAGVKKFSELMTKYGHDAELVSGKYVVDAHSVMGIFSLDLSKPVDFHAEVENSVTRETWRAFGVGEEK